VPVHSLDQLLILLLASVLIVALARRVGLPTILGYLLVGIVLGPGALNALSSGPETRAIAETGVVFLLFTLGLAFSYPRMVAMRREVFGVGSAQTAAICAVAALLLNRSGIGWSSAIVVGGAIAMCSTAIVLQQLGDQDEINRTHGRLAFAVLLFQDLAFVPLLALATVLAQGMQASGGVLLLRLVALGLVALAAVLLIGRFVVRPLLHLIAHSRLRELFTLAALLVALTSAWITQRLGLSMALGAFLAGMMLAETQYRHQIDAAIRPFRELLLGLFFISVGALLDLRVLFAHLGLIIGLVVLLLSAKMLLSTAILMVFAVPPFKAMRTGAVLAGGGEFGVALLAILAQGNGLVAPREMQLLLTSVTLSMIASPLIIRYNKRIARFLLREHGPPGPPAPRDFAGASELARREHVVLCGFGRVGRHLARVLESQGFEYLGVDLDPNKVREARSAGDPVIWGDSADDELWHHLGLPKASVVIVTFANPNVAVGIVRTVRRLRADVPILVRTQDDSRLEELSRAGATEIVPETFETGLTLVLQALTLLRLPPAQVMQIADALRRQRYVTLPDSTGTSLRLSEGRGEESEPQIRSVVLPPGAWAVGRRLEQVCAQGAPIAVTAIRRHGIVGRAPAGDTELQEGDVVIMFGNPSDLEQAEAVLLAG
jgi:CPA2 family monovalent cation:H+ antiporter-2